MKKYLIAFSMMILSISGHCQFSNSEIWNKGLWMYVSETDKTRFVVDINNIKLYENKIHTYLALIDKDKKTYTGPFEFIIDCQAKSYTLNKGHTPRWVNTSAGGIAALKICGDIDQASGDKYEFLFSFYTEERKGGVDTYWVPNDVVSDLNNPNIIIVKLFYSIAPPPLTFNLSNGNMTGTLSELDCSNLKNRNTSGVAGKINIDSSKDWIALSKESIIYSKICMNKNLLIRQVIKPLQSNTVNIETAKSKCEELGFSIDTEGYGKCALQLTK